MHNQEGQYETAAERFGGGTARKVAQPKVKAERSFTFSEEDIKLILAKYVEDNYDTGIVDINQVRGDWASSSGYGQFNHSPGYCRFTVKVSG